MRAVFVLAFCALAGAAEEKFISSVHLSVQEPNPELMIRGQRLVAEQFRSALEVSPILRAHQFETHTNGNEMVFLLSADADLRAPVQDVLAEMINHLNGRVLARGKSMFYRAALSQEQDGFLEVVLDEPPKPAPLVRKNLKKGQPLPLLEEEVDEPRRILAISAQSVSLRDLLKEIRNQAGNFSYLIPGECAEKLVDWSFGDTAPSQPKDMELVMSELATMFGLKSEKKNGTYIFTGVCPEHTNPARSKHADIRPIRARSFLMGPQPYIGAPASRKAGRGGAPESTPVFLPLMPGME